MKDSNRTVLKRNHQVHPVGAIYWSALCRYLSAVAHRQFWQLDNADVNQYALIIIFRITRRFEDHYNHASVWESLAPGASKRDFLLVPGTQEGCQYHAEHSDGTLLVRDVKDITAFFRRAFLNLVISDLRENAKQQKIKREALGKAASTRFRRTVAHSYSLDAFANDIEQQRRQTDLECALDIIRKMYKSMSRPDDSTVFELFLQQYKPTEIAEMTEMSEPDVRNTILRCKRKFRSLWNRMETSDGKKTP